MMHHKVDAKGGYDKNQRFMLLTLDRREGEGFMSIASCEIGVLVKHSLPSFIAFDKSPSSGAGGTTRFKHSNNALRS